MTSEASYGSTCLVPVRRAAMVHRWEELTFIHWRYPAEVVQRLLPAGLEVESFDGTAWVGLVPFFMRVGLPGVASVPWFSRFPETNVRTYVRDRDGQSGIWFFSLDAARLGAVLVARSTYRLPYFWSEMTVVRHGDRLTYRCRRRWPGPPGATSRADVEVGAPFTPSELGGLDHFLTARWALYAAPPAGLRHARAFHDPWPLHRARLLDLHDELVPAAGLPPPTGDPLVHFSRTVRVRVGWPHAAGPPKRPR